MGRETQVNVRLSFEEKGQIEANAKRVGKKVGPYLRDLGLSEGSDFGPASVEPNEAKDLSEIDPRLALPNPHLNHRVRQLIASGSSPERAEHQARRELGL